MARGDCPTGCGRDVQFGKLMCGPCWSLVPKALQRDVTYAWGSHMKLMRSAGRTMADVQTSRKKYGAAKEAAIASVP